MSIVYTLCALAPSYSFALPPSDTDHQSELLDSSQVGPDAHDSDHQGELLDTNQVGANAHNPDHQGQLLDPKRVTPYPHAHTQTSVKKKHHHSKKHTAPQSSQNPPLTSETPNVGGAAPSDAMPARDNSNVAPAADNFPR